VLRVRWATRLAAAAAVLVASWTVLGTTFHRLIEGMDRTQILRPALAVPLALILVAIRAWTARVPRAACPACGWRPRAWLLQPASGEAALPERRRLLRVLGASLAAGAGAFGAVLLRNRGWIRVGRNIGPPVETMAPVARPEWRGARVRNYRRLGRTGVMVSDISLGSSNIKSVEVARLALERGVTYFDTAPDYARHGSEEILGEAMQGRRNEVFVASKFCTGDGHLPPEAPVARIIEAVEGSLRRLRTDRIDLLHIHSCDRVERLTAPNFHEAFDRLREQGKARFLGVSTHTPNLAAVANAAIDSGRFDVLMLAYHFGMGWDLERILARAAERDVAVVAMKTLKGAKHQNLAGFREEAGSYTQAAFRWVLSNPHVSCLVISFSELRHVDEYLYASGTRLTSADRAVLAKYDALVAGDYCHPHCGACLPSCPVGLPIHDVLRYEMYFADYGAEKEAMRKYARLGEQNASLCLGCPAPCAGACPHGVSIQAKMIEAHGRLTLA
jgi:aryl-alcohol dehydrogenase-like predicted oxidoreductase